MSGLVIGLFTSDKASARLTQKSEVRAVPGRGHEGDRYFRSAGTFSKPKEPRPDMQATLIQQEAIEAVAREHGIQLQPHESRRNILTQGINLNALVGCEFSVGEVRMRGIKLCEPCGHLERLTRPGVRDAFLGRGGLRAQILSEGTIRVGDAIVDQQPSESLSCR